MRTSEKKKRNIIIGSVLGVLVLMTVGYAAFSSVLNITGTSGISSNWDIKITSITEGTKTGGATTSLNEDGSKKISGVGTLTATIEADLVSPGDSIEYDITVTNSGTIDAKLEKITKTESNNPAIIFETSGLTEGSTLTANGGTATLKLKIIYDSSVTSQPENTVGTLSVTLDYVQNDGSGTVTPGGETAADKLIATETTSGDGLYADDTETGRYIYKGTNPSNYITFNNESWRIMSVESDNTIKIIRNESIGNKQWDGSSSNKWTRPATLNTYLNTTYLGTINEDSKYIVDHNFNVGTPGNTSDTEDIATDVVQEAQTTWNGKIGLMTITEILKTTSNTTCTSLKAGRDSASTGYCNTNNWLWPKSGYLWTISPSPVASYYVWRAHSDGYVLISRATNDNHGVLPVLYLTSNIQLEGEGTSGSPYTIVS